jgi:hypothetical protein
MAFRYYDTGFEDVSIRPPKRRLPLKEMYIIGYVLAALLTFVSTHNVLLALIKGLLSWGYVIYFIIRFFGM